MRRSGTVRIVRAGRQRVRVRFEADPDEAALLARLGLPSLDSHVVTPAQLRAADREARRAKSSEPFAPLTAAVVRDRAERGEVVALVDLLDGIGGERPEEDAFAELMDVQRAVSTQSARDRELWLRVFKLVRDGMNPKAAVAQAAREQRFDAKRLSAARRRLASDAGITDRRNRREHGDGA